MATWKKAAGSIVLCVAMALSATGQVRLIPGIITDTVDCLSDPGQTYALFLPSNYRADTVWPVLYIFDAAARGKLPLERFRYAAENYGFILVCSNNSRNGPWNAIDKATDAVFRDTRQRFPIDTSRIYTSGFSGGARVASAAGIRYPQIKGVIGCGAGFSPAWPPEYTISFDYIGLIGTLDFNYFEMQRLDRTLTTLGKTHLILPFSSGHEWPDSLTAFDALSWLQFRAMEKGLMPADSILVRSFITGYIRRRLNEAPDAYMASLVLRQALSFAGSLVNTDSILSLLDSIQSSEDYHDDQRRYDRIAKKEAKYLAAYNDAFIRISTRFIYPEAQVQTQYWWHREVGKALAMVRNGKTAADTLLGRRLIDYIWRESYIQYSSASTSPNTAVLHEYLDIWAIARPDMPEPHYYKARVLVRSNDNYEAITELQEAVDLGFSDREFMLNDLQLAPLYEEAAFKELIAGIR